MAIPRTDPLVAIPHLLARSGYRLTGPRRAVVEVLAQSREPMTVGAIHASLGPNRANLVSVYRAVKLLTGIGLLRATDTSHGQRRYELNEQFTGHHHHLICQRCGRIQDLQGCILADDVLARVNQRVRHSRQFRVTDHELRLFGICRDCDA